MRLRVAKWIRKWRTEWAITTVALYLLAIPATIIVFPGNSLWLALLIIFTGLTESLTSSADLLVDGDEEKKDG